MTKERRGSGRVAVIEEPATWPESPQWWSHSSLTEAEQCPRRWALRRASYSNVWGKDGYPDRVTLPAIRGEVVHDSIEVIVRALNKAGSSGSDAKAVGVMRELGGYSEIVTTVIADKVESLASNPRSSSTLEFLQTDLTRSLPDLRERVQAAVSRIELAPRETKKARTSGANSSLGSGTYSEITLTAESVRFTGRIDLLTVDQAGVTIVDFKTGKAQADHANQLLAYALLWNQDVRANPSALPVIRLVDSYLDGDVSVPVPSSEQLDDLASSLVQRIAAADASVSAQPPEARPSENTCAHCPVRHLCDDYWTVRESLSHSELPRFTDVMVHLIDQPGPHSWSVVVGSATKREADAIFRVPAGLTIELSSGQHLRLIDVAVAIDEESETTIVTTTRRSEIFELVG